MAAATLAACTPGDPGEPSAVDESWLGAAPAGSNASPAGHTIPTALFPGEKRRVSVDMLNTGSVTWTTQFGLYREPPYVWSFVYDVLTSPNVGPGGTESYSFIVTAPTTPGTYAFNARMRKIFGTSTGPFGTPFALPGIGVSTANTPQFWCELDTAAPSYAIPTRAAAGRSVNVTIPIRNAGTDTWTFVSSTQNVNLRSVDVPTKLWGSHCEAVSLSSYPVAPGATVDVTCRLTAPTTLGPTPFRRTLYDSRSGGVGFFQSAANACVNVSIDVVLCGNGTLDPGEECDDGNLANGDACTDFCLHSVEHDLAADLTSDATFVGSTGNKQLSSVGALDLTGDGRPELFMGEISHAPAELVVGSFRNQSGRVVAYESVAAFSAPNPKTVPSGRYAQMFGADPGDRLGQMSRGVLLAADLGFGDAGPELTLSAPGGDGPGNTRTDVGEVMVLDRTAIVGDMDLRVHAAVKAIVYGAVTRGELRVLAGGLDLIGDASPDLVLGTAGAGGAIYVVEGGPRLFAASPVDLLSPPAPATLEIATISYSSTVSGSIGGAAAIGDLNGDGDPDLLFGNSGFDGPAGENSGIAYALFGPFTGGATIDMSSPPASSVVWHGATEFAGLGTSVAIAQALGSSTLDAIIGAPGHQKGDALPYGAVDVWTGPLAPGVIPLHLGATPSGRVLGAEHADSCGQNVVASDMNGDGFADLAIVCSTADGPTNGVDRAGELHVVRGGPSLSSASPIDLLTATPMLSVFGRATADTLGHHRGSLGIFDLDGDGRTDDVAVGSFLGGAPFATLAPGTTDFFLFP